MIVFKSVYRTFDPDESGLKDISFSVTPGELVMITGHSGSGKTTIMRLLTKEYLPNKGEIHFDNQELSKINKARLHEHRRKIGVVFQDYRLISEMNVWENIALPLAITGKKQHEIEERVTDLLNLVQLPEKAYLFPSQLSGGEAQRISIARALANAPSVIFADEPTGNLDQDTSQSIAHLLKQINELGTTLIFATHDPKVLAIFSDKRHINLKNGSIEFDTSEKKPSSTTSKSAPKKSEDVPEKTAPQKTEDAEVEKSAKETKKSDLDRKESVSDPSDTLETVPIDTKESKKSDGFFARLFGKKQAMIAPDEVAEKETPLEASDSKTDAAAQDTDTTNAHEALEKKSPITTLQNQLKNRPTKNPAKKSPLLKVKQPRRAKNNL